MLVKYKNLNNNKITEEENLFINQLHEIFPDVDRSFVRATVSCIRDVIFKENEIGIVKEGRRIQEKVESNIKNFLSEIKRFSQAPNHYKPKTNLDLEGFDGESLKFLLRASPEDLAEFAESYDTTIPDVSRERICEVTGFIFDAMREATERGLDGERCQTEKERIAEETWNKGYPEKENIPSSTISSPVESAFAAEERSVIFKS